MLGPFLDEQDDSDIAAAVRVTTEQTGLEAKDFTIYANIFMTLGHAETNVQIKTILFAAQLHPDKFTQIIEREKDKDKQQTGIKWMTKRDILGRDSECILPFKHRINEFEEKIASSDPSILMH